MPQYVIYKNGAYNIYSTISEECYFESALSRKQMVAYLSSQKMKRPEERVQKAEETGTSSRTLTLTDIVDQFNLSFPPEHQLTFEQFVQKYLTRVTVDFEEVEEEIIDVKFPGRQAYAEALIVEEKKNKKLYVACEADRRVSLFSGDPEHASVELEIDEIKALYFALKTFLTKNGEEV